MPLEAEAAGGLGTSSGLASAHDLSGLLVFLSLLSPSPSQLVALMKLGPSPEPPNQETRLRRGKWKTPLCDFRDRPSGQQVVF